MPTVRERAGGGAHPAGVRAARAAGASALSAPERPDVQSLVSLEQGVLRHCLCDPKSTDTPTPSSTPMIEPRPYLSWVTLSLTEYRSASVGGTAVSATLHGLPGRGRRV